MTTPLFTGSDWSPELLAKVTGEISRIAEEELNLDCFPMHICTITAEQMPRSTFTRLKSTKMNSLKNMKNNEKRIMPYDP